MRGKLEISHRNLMARHFLEERRHSFSECDIAIDKRTKRCDELLEVYRNGRGVM